MTLSGFIHFVRASVFWRSVHCCHLNSQVSEWINARSLHSNANYTFFSALITIHCWHLVLGCERLCDEQISFWHHFLGFLILLTGAMWYISFNCHLTKLILYSKFNYRKSVDAWLLLFLAADHNSQSFNAILNCRYWWYSIFGLKWWLRHSEFELLLTVTILNIFNFILTFPEFPLYSHQSARIISLILCSIYKLIYF